MPSNLRAATELIQIRRGCDAVRFLAIGPLVKAKFQSYGRGFPGDYRDLVFVCTHPTYGRELRDFAEEIRSGKRAALLEEVARREPAKVEAVRWALRLDRSPTPEASGSERPGSSGGGTGGGGSRGLHSGRDRQSSSSTQSSGDGRADGGSRRHTGARSTPPAHGGTTHGTNTSSSHSHSQARTKASSRVAGSLTSQMRGLTVSTTPSDRRATERRSTASATTAIHGTERGYSSSYRTSTPRHSATNVTWGSEAHGRRHP